MNKLKLASVLYFGVMWISIPILFAMKDHFFQIFSLRIFIGFALATIFLAGTAFLVYLICTHWRFKSPLSLLSIWTFLPVCMISVFMQVGFGALYTRVHGMGYIHGLGDAQTSWVVFCSISVVASILTYFAFVRKS